MTRKLPEEFSLMEASHPILSCSDSAAWEKRLLSTEEAVWAAMTRVGRSCAQALRFDYRMARLRRSGLKVLALVGKGHNGGDALLVLAELAREPGLLREITVALVAGPAEQRPLVRKAWEQLEQRAQIRRIGLADLGANLAGSSYDLCIDGLLGMSFRPPLRPGVAQAIEAVNAAGSIACRIAIDLPSGIGDERSETPFQADLTYATGIFKRPLLDCPEAGLRRYLDIGLFEQERPGPWRVLSDHVLEPLRGLRPARSEKRQFGHLAVVAGSRTMPGALLMSVEAAIRSGVGLVTVFAPESVVPQMAARVPEAMWRPWPETPEGGLALEGLWQIRSIADRASALLLGPGMGRERETTALLREIVREWGGALLLDADALMPDIIGRLAKQGDTRCIVTPHDGEFLRISEGSELSDEACVSFAEANGVTLIKKGSLTRVAGAGQLFACPTGNPALARGGSGDLLAGLTAGLLAQFPEHPLEVACMGVYWHGKAADLLAVARGQTAIRTTDWVDFLTAALEHGAAWNPHSPPDATPIGS